MPITEAEWESIAQFSAKVVKDVVGTKGDFFVTGTVIKVDAPNKCIYLAEFGDQPIPMVGFDRSVRYYDTSQQSGFPIAGVIFDYAGASAPQGFLLCDGTSYLRADYADLFVALGGAASPWGLPDGTHFNVPDFRDRVAVGKSGTRALGSTGGAATHTLAVTEMPNHGHAVEAYGTLSGSIGKGIYTDYTGGGAQTAVIGPSPTGGVAGVANPYGAIGVGGGGAHNNMQPYAAASKIISIGSAPQVSAKPAQSEISMPKVGDNVLVAREMGTARLPRALGVIQGKNWVVSGDE